VISEKNDSTWEGLFATMLHFVCMCIYNVSMHGTYIGVLDPVRLEVILDICLCAKNIMLIL